MKHLRLFALAVIFLPVLASAQDWLKNAPEKPQTTPAPKKPGAATPKPKETGAGQIPQALIQYLDELRKNPDDVALREMIIKFVRGMKTQPAVPESAREHYMIAETFAERERADPAMATGDVYANGKLVRRGVVSRAVVEYKAALAEAPWWAEAYRKLADAQKVTKHYDDAIASLNFYLLTQPADSREAQDEVYRLRALKEIAQQAAGEAAREQAAQEQIARDAEAARQAEAKRQADAQAAEAKRQSDAQAAEAKRREEIERLTGDALSGAWHGQTCPTANIRVSGNSFYATLDCVNLDGRAASMTLSGTKRGLSLSGTATIGGIFSATTNCTTPEVSTNFTGDISPDGKGISIDTSTPSWYTHARVFLFVRTCDATTLTGWSPSHFEFTR